MEYVFIFLYSSAFINNKRFHIFLQTIFYILKSLLV